MGSDATGVCFASGKIKIPCQTGMGRNDFHQWDKGNAKLAGLFTQPSIAFHKGSFHYVQRVRIPHRGQSPSSVTQLPILPALHARIPTLFFLIIHDMAEKVNPQSDFYFAGREP